VYNYLKKGKKIKPLYDTKAIKTINCPQCGYELPIYFRWTKLIECPSCKSSIFLEDEGAKVIGKASTLSPEPSLVKIGEPLIIEKKTYMPLGKIRYSYGRGFWEEYFLKGEDSREYWLSIDEGDFALEKPMNIPLPIHSFDELTVGAEYGKYIVTEVGQGKCVGFEGELPKLISVEDTHNYAHLSKGGASLVTIEFRDKDMSIYSGEWIDPFSISGVYE
jgi:DNA-directed RNA polymerase subunit RPC12/RpoP